jgi:hypothetical protein
MLRGVKAFQAFARLRKQRNGNETKRKSSHDILLRLRLRLRSRASCASLAFQLMAMKRRATIYISSEKDLSVGWAAFEDD